MIVRPDRTFEKFEGALGVLTIHSPFDLLTVELKGLPTWLQQKAMAVGDCSLFTHFLLAVNSLFAHYCMQGWNSPRITITSGISPSHLPHISLIPPSYLPHISLTPPSYNNYLGLTHYSLINHSPLAAHRAVKALKFKPLLQLFLDQVTILSLSAHYPLTTPSLYLLTIRCCSHLRKSLKCSAVWCVN